MSEQLTADEIEHVKEAFVRFAPDSDLHTEISATILKKLETPQDSDLAFCRAERDAAIEVSETAKRYVAAMEAKLAGHERELADLIAAFYRREIGSIMQQAEHWAQHNFPLAVHHRVLKADSYYQIVALCERFAEWGENPFKNMRDELKRKPIKPPGTYPPTVEINEYRHPKFVVEKLKTASKAAGGPA